VPATHVRDVRLGPAAPSRHGFSFSQSDFDRVASLARSAWGLALEPHKRDLVYSRLARRLRALRLCDFDAYFQLLAGPDGEEERVHLLTALTTNVTSFFREPHHFDILRQHIAPQLRRRALARRPVRLWSAGCSSGQEAYSIAMVMLHAFPEAATLDVRILASDVDPLVLASAARARYPEVELVDIPEAMHRACLVRRPEGSFEVAERVRRLVTFAEINLVEPWPMGTRFDVIFCRNVVIYFDAATQQRLWDRLVDALVPGGTLMIGHSERITGGARDALTPGGITTYVKAPHDAAPGDI
jgi:chemotaxis protein methyltransferase CheR